MCTQIRESRLSILTFSLITLFFFMSSCMQKSLKLKKAQNEVTDDLQLKEVGKMHATSADIDQYNKTYIVLYWKPEDGAVGYNLYRRKKNEESMPVLPINGKKSICSVKTCDELKAIIPEGSPEWKILENAFSTLSMKEKTKVEGTQKGMGTKVLGLSSGIGTLRPDLDLIKLHLCYVFERGLTDDEEEIFNNVAIVNLKFRRARGLGFIDQNVVANEHYIYELRGIKPDGKEVVIAQDVKVWAGHFTLPGPPSGFTLTAGDRKVLATWNRNPNAYDYMIRRSSGPIDVPYQIVNDEPIFYDINKNLEGEDIALRPGFVDFQRWSDDGFPISHKVNNVDVDGPENYVKYYYQVASRDILGRQGYWSNHQTATPTDETPPTAPSGLKVDPSTDIPSSGLVLTWRKVTRDINGHQELDTKHTYKIYRAESQDLLDQIDPVTQAIPLPGYFVHSLTATLTDPIMTIAWTDNASIIFPTYGEKDFWYRITCIDAHGNVSSPSAAISGRTPDITPPGSTRVTGAVPDFDHITIMWEPNTEPDLAGYQIYRGICDRGKVYQPDQEEKGCGFVLLGEILVEEAKKRREQTGSIYYEDYSVSKDAPICYAYWIRAFDMARNVYQGNYGCPTSPDEYVCQRIYEKTPPPIPIISGLKAKNNSVLIEWISSPVQDLRAFHVYRAKNENDPPVFVSCVLSDGTPWPGRWTGMQPVCEDIPAEPNPTSVKGSFIDKGLEPNQVFWYRVSALDWLGNESEGNDIAKIPGISTFTYSKDLPATPIVLPPSDTTTPDCGLVVRWKPAFDPTKLKGFLVFRSTSKIGTYRQVSPIVKKDEFNDKSAIKDIDYWYRVQAMDNLDKLSEPSAAIHYKY